jgi:tRNA 2-thiouridine synthesizing protein C
LLIEVGDVKKILIVVNSPPYGSTNAGEGIRVAVALAGMDLDTTVLLIGDGVFAALKNQTPEAIGAASLKEGLSNAHEFGARIVAHEESLSERGISKDQLLEVDLVNNESVSRLIHEADSSITF